MVARGRGRGRSARNASVPQESSASVARSATVERAGESALSQDARVVDLLTRLLERFPEVVPAQAPAEPPRAEAQPREVAAGEAPSYLKMMEQMQRIGTGFFKGGAKPEEAEEWRSRLERNFQSIRCPEEYRVDLAVHYLESDAHLWWRGVTARRAAVEMTWNDFVEEFNSKFFPQEALDRLEGRFLDLTQGSRTVREYEAEFNRLKVYAGRSLDEEKAQVRRFLRGLRVELRNRCLVRTFDTVAELVEKAALIEDGLRDEAKVVSQGVQTRKPQQPSSAARSDRPVQGLKRRWDDASRLTRVGQGCFQCGSKEHRIADCPKQGERRTCYHCKEAGHIKTSCPKLQQGGTVIAPPAKRDAVAPRVYSMGAQAGETSSRPITGKHLNRLLLIVMIIKSYVDCLSKEKF